MRIWDIPTKKLCREHLLGEHRELHAIWSILVNNKKGYSNHPETKRWKGKLNALYKRHQEEAGEMLHRNYNHRSPLDQKLATGERKQTAFINTPEEQKNILTKKDCDCRI
jgi:hypothetical protein